MFFGFFFFVYDSKINKLLECLLNEATIYSALHTSSLWTVKCSMIPMWSYSIIVMKNFNVHRIENVKTWQFNFFCWWTAAHKQYVEKNCKLFWRMNIVSQKSKILCYNAKNLCNWDQAVLQRNISANKLETLWSTTISECPIL